MSYRSALTNPSISSGGIGSVYTATQTSGSIPLINGTNENTASIVVPAGVYSVISCVEIYIQNTTIVQLGTLYISSSSPDDITPTSFLAKSNILAPFTGVPNTTDTFTYTLSSPIVLTEPTKLYTTILFEFTTSGMDSQIPFPYSIRAVKLA